MRIALRIFLSYLFLALLLGGGMLFTALLSIERLVSGIVEEAAASMGRELGLFLTSVPGRESLDDLTEEEQTRVQDQISNYVRRSHEIETVLIVDTEGRIRFSSEPDTIGMVFRNQAEREILLADEITTRPVPRGSEGYLHEITVPIRSQGSRIGTLRFRVIPQYFLDYLDEPRRNALWVFVGMVVFITASGVVLASAMTLPVRRLNRTLQELQNRGGAARVEVDERSDFAPTLRVVRGLGERLEALAASSRSNELLLSTLTQALEQGVLVVNASGEIVTINEAASRMLGYPAGREITIESLRHRDPDFARLLRAGPVDGLVTYDLPARPGRRGIRVSAHALREGGEPAGTMLFLQDLDSVRGLEKHLQEASRLSLLARLTSTVAHEIKNPLNSIVINAESLRSSLEELPAEIRVDSERTLEMIVGEIYHLDEVIRQYLGLASEGADREGTLTDVRIVIENVLELIRFEANQSNVRVVADVSGDLPQVPAVAVRLKQALLNLCLNAIQAMSDGGVLTVRVRAGGEDVTIEVSDTGPGIPQELRSSIFSFHFTTKARGSGLGLPITRMIVESVGGSIEYDCEPGRGTTFRLRIPATEPATLPSA